MTTNQIKLYQVDVERQHQERSDRETRRHNKKQERLIKKQNKETKRHDKATELLTSRQIDETVRHNVAGEQYNVSYLAEQSRHNIATEYLSSQANQIAQYNADTNRYSAESGRISALANQISSEASRTSAAAAYQNSLTNSVLAAETRRHNLESESMQASVNTENARHNAALERISDISSTYQNQRTLADTQYINTRNDYQSLVNDAFNTNTWVNNFNTFNSGVKNLQSALSSRRQDAKDAITFITPFIMD